jgi:hypothetical protein
VDPVRRALLALLVGLALALLPVHAAGAQDGDRGLEMEGELAGVDLATAGDDDPIPLDPTAPIPLRLTITNRGDDIEEIRHVRLEGKALGLTFLTYDLGIRATLSPGDQTSLTTALEFFDLERQATGYLGTSLRVYDPDGHLLAEQHFVVDVLGDATSTLGLFALVVTALAVFSASVLVFNTLRRRLPANRFVRGVQFAVTGATIGVTLSLGVSILRIAFAEVDAWVPVVLLPTVIAFGLGYLAPGPLQRSIRDYQAEEALQGAARAAVERVSGVNEAAVAARASGQRSGAHDADPTRTTR